MKVNIHTMEGLLRGKCLPANILVNESLSAYLVRQFEALHEQAEAAERERDEMSGALKAAAVNAETWMKRALKAEVEIARRDAAAGEPFAYIDISHLDQFGWGFVFKHPSPAAGFKYPVYTAAAPAVLPPEKPVNTDLSRTDIMKNISYNQALNDVKALGAQPQKPVVLPEPERHREPGIIVGMYESFVVYKALDEAGVPYEVNK